MAGLPSPPHLDRPILDGLVPLDARTGAQHIGNRDLTAPRGQREYWPRPPAPRHLHVRPLHLSSGIVSLEMKKKPDQGERQFDRFGILVGGLRGKRVNRMLMDKSRIGM